jgi:hypothetical protein
MQIQMQCDIGSRYKSPAQRARVITEFWAERNLYCIHCDSDSVNRSRPNTQAVDFVCPACHSPFQLKCQCSPFSTRVVDAGYDAMRRAIEEDRTPHLIVAHYDRDSWEMKNVLLVPRFAFSMSVIEKRKPLGPCCTPSRMDRLQHPPM